MRNLDVQVLVVPGLAGHVLMVCVLAVHSLMVYILQARIAPPHVLAAVSHKRCAVPCSMGNVRGTMFVGRLGKTAFKTDTLCFTKQLF